MNSGHRSARRCFAFAGNQRQTFAGSQSVVLFAVVVGVKELLEPLNKLKVVLETTLYQLLYWYYLEKKQQQKID